MKTICMTAACAAMAFTAIPFASPAMAQGTVGPTPVVGASCPSGYQSGRGGKDPKICYPLGSDAPSIYVANGPCAPGYRKDYAYCTSKAESATYIPPTYGSITKANALDRCPVGYWTDEGSLKICSTPYQGKAPASRLKKGTACAADEVDEWGVYCTSKQHRLTRSEAENTAVADVNNLFALSGGKTSPQGADYENTPGIRGLFAGGGGAAAASASANGDLASQTGQNSGCANGSATGAAIGGAMAGEGGAVLGSILGGLGKKKKKQGC